MFESDFEDNIFRRRLMKEVAPGLPVHFSFYSPRVKVQVQESAEHLPGANGRYIGDGVTIEFVPQDAAAVERVREFVWRWEEHNEFTAVRKIAHLRRGADPGSVQGILERVRGVDKRAAAKAAEAVEPDELEEMIEAEDAKTLARLPGLGEKRAHAVVEFYRNERSRPGPVSGRPGSPRCKRAAGTYYDPQREPGAPPAHDALAHGQGRLLPGADHDLR